MKIKCLFISFLCLASIFLLGCNQQKTETSSAANKSILETNSGDFTISGQIFIVTKGRENIVLGGETIALLDGHEAGQYYNQMVPIWRSNLTVLQSNIDLDFAAYQSIDKSNLDKFIAAKQYWKNQENNPDNFIAAQNWEQKINDQMESIFQARRSSEIYTKLMDENDSRSNLIENITRPEPEFFSPQISHATSDSQGRFKFSVDGKYKDSYLLLMAKSSREAPGGHEDYFWLVDVGNEGKNERDCILSSANENLYSTGSTFFEDSDRNWFSDYELKIISDDVNYRISNAQSDIEFPK